MEHKLLSLSDVELKFSGQAGQFTGYASVFNGVDSYGDMILPGAYADTIKNRQRPVRMFYNHDARWPIGKWLSVEEDGKGLLVSGELTPGHSLASDVKAAMSHGTLDGLSIGYRIPSGGSEKDGKVRKLKRIDLVEVSVVTTPADLNARIDPESIKSAIDQIESIKELEDFLRDAGGFSRAAAAALVSQFKVAVQRDAEVRAKSEAEAISAILAATKWPGSIR